jgi:hypothetical protein
MLLGGLPRERPAITERSGGGVKQVMIQNLGDEISDVDLKSIFEREEIEVRHLADRQSVSNNYYFC